MFVELHLLQNFPPHCLNRDDTNSPKDCVFGGYRRARISSQCLKRAIRTHFRQADLLPENHLARRSKRLVKLVAERLVKDHHRDEAEALQKTAMALASQKITTDDQQETQYLLFLGEQEIVRLAGTVNEHWDALKSDSDSEKGETESKKKQKQQARNAVPDEVRKAVTDLLDGGGAADLALFGRMLADQSTLNIDAACQVAHAISTNKVSMEMDFFTAVDDLKDRSQQDEDAGAGMLGTVEFNSSCFYRYANIDLNQLTDNLQGDNELAQQSVKAFLQGAVEAVPTGKQNSMAAHNLPSFVFAVVRERGLWSLANAFVEPARPRNNRDLVDDSIERLDSYWNRLCQGYGEDGLHVRPAFVLNEAGMDEDDRTQLNFLKPHQVGSFEKVVDTVMQAVNASQERSS